MKTLVLVACFLASAGAGLAETVEPAAEPCIVCGATTEGSQRSREYRGRPHTVCSDRCAAHWDAAQRDGSLDAVVRQIEPRGALFQGDSRFLNPDFQGDRPVDTRAITFGIWVLAALVSGGVAAAVAVPAHRPARWAFVVGFALPVIGVAAAFALPRQSGELPIRGNRIPSTRDETSCPACGRASHPSAARCAGCGGTLTPTVQSEVEKVRASA